MSIYKFLYHQFTWQVVHHQRLRYYITFTFLRACSPLPVSGLQEEKTHTFNVGTWVRFWEVWTFVWKIIFLSHTTHILWCLYSVLKHTVTLVLPAKAAGCNSVVLNPRWWRNLISLTYGCWWHRETEETEEDVRKERSMSAAPPKEIIYTWLDSAFLFVPPFPRSSSSPTAAHCNHTDLWHRHAFKTLYC